MNPEIARNRESSNAAAELGLLRFAHGKPGRAPLLVVTMTPPRLLSPQHVVLDPHRILPYCVSGQQNQLSYLTLWCGLSSENENKREADARTFKRLISRSPGGNER